MIRNNNRNWVKLLFVIISLIVFIWLIDFKKIKELFLQLNLILFILAIVLILTRHIFQSYKFYEILRLCKISLPFSLINVHYFIGYYYNFFLPSSIGGDIVRVVLMSNNGVQKKDSGNIIFLERLLGIISLALIAAISVFFIPFSIQDTNYIYWIIFVFISTLPIFYKLKHNKKLKPFHEWLNTFNSLNFKKLLYIFSLTIVFQVFSIYIRYLLSNAFNINIEFEYFLLFIPIINFVTLLPISINGFGTREASFIFLFGLVGVVKEDAFVLSMTSYILMLILGAIGAICSIVSNIESIIPKSHEIN